MSTAAQQATERVTAFLHSLEAEVRHAGPEEWAIALESAGYPLEVAVIIRGPLLRVQAAVLPAETIDPHQLLVWNRQAPLVCFSENLAGEVFVTGELPLEQLSTEMFDRFLGLLLASSTRAREFAISSD